MSTAAQFRFPQTCPITTLTRLIFFTLSVFREMMSQPQCLFESSLLKFHSQSSFCPWGTGNSNASSRL
ncbi:hypothetical protein XENTR_v10008910 [Xenopus tropicalis]|nr:hypothetical protein XENTR_v10008910 [Xenopus tropicalis]